MNATTPAASVPAAGLWPRFAAMVYETILLVGLVFVSSWLFIKLLGDASHAPMRHVFQGYVVAVCGAYFIYCWRHSGQTLAMKTWGLRLVGNNEQALTLNRALVRYVLAILGLAAGGMGFLWALLDPDRQFLHDRLLGTRIVRAPI